jgi:hypothetical protein
MIAQRAIHLFKASDFAHARRLRISLKNPAIWLWSVFDGVPILVAKNSLYGSPKSRP